MADIVAKILLLAGDIGGTNARFRLSELRIKSNGTCSTVVKKTLIRRILTSEDNLTSFIQQFLTKDCGLSKGARWPEAAVLAVAGPVDKNNCGMTNLMLKFGSKWLLKGDEMAQELGFKVELINDFVAAGYGVLSLDVNNPDDGVVTLHNVPRRVGAPIACIGAGTGLGEAYLTHNDVTKEYTAHGTEGGHCDFGPRSALEAGLLKFVARRVAFEKQEQKDKAAAEGTPAPRVGEKTEEEHVSVERIVCGGGLTAIFEYLSQFMPIVSPALRKALDGVSRSDYPMILTQFAKPHMKNGQYVAPDTVAAAAMDMFVSLYGAEAGNMALKIVPQGGLFICGGVASKIMWAMKKDNNFVKNFLAKGRDNIQAVLRSVPIYVVMKANDIGLDGSRVRCLQLLRQLKKDAFANIPYGTKIPQVHEKSSKL